MNLMLVCCMIVFVINWRASEESFPVQKKTYKVFKNKYKPWITTASINSVKEKNKLYKRYMQTKSLESKLIYRNYIKTS